MISDVARSEQISVTAPSRNTLFSLFSLRHPPSFPLRLPSNPRPLSLSISLSLSSPFSLYPRPVDDSLSSVRCAPARLGRIHHDDDDDNDVAPRHDENSHCERDFTSRRHTQRNTKELSLSADPRNSGMNTEENKTFVSG